MKSISHDKPWTALSQGGNWVAIQSVTCGLTRWVGGQVQKKKIQPANQQFHQPPHDASFYCACNVTKLDMQKTWEKRKGKGKPENDRLKSLRSPFDHDSSIRYLIHSDITQDLHVRGLASVRRQAVDTRARTEPANYIYQSYKIYLNSSVNHLDG